MLIVLQSFENINFWLCYEVLNIIKKVVRQKKSSLKKGSLKKGSLKKVV